MEERSLAAVDELKVSDRDDRADGALLGELVGVELCIGSEEESHVHEA